MAPRDGSFIPLTPNPSPPEYRERGEQAGGKIGTSDTIPK